MSEGVLFEHIGRQFQVAAAWVLVSLIGICLVILVLYIGLVLCCRGCGLTLYHCCCHVLNLCEGSARLEGISAYIHSACISFSILLSPEDTGSYICWCHLVAPFKVGYPRCRWAQEIPLEFVTIALITRWVILHRGHRNNILRWSIL